MASGKFKVSYILWISPPNADSFLYSVQIEQSTSKGRKSYYWSSLDQEPIPRPVGFEQRDMII